MIEINNTKNVNHQWQFVFITLAVDGDSCRHTVATPVLTGVTLQSYCNTNEPSYALEVLRQMYPGARYQDSEGNTEIAKFTQWIADGHTNAAYCQSGNPYCTIQSTSAYCEGAEGEDQASCELNGGTWVSEVSSPSNQVDCEKAEGAWVTTFDTEEKCLLAGSQWIPEEVIEKVPWVHSHDFTGDHTINSQLIEISKAQAAAQEQGYTCSNGIKLQTRDKDFDRWSQLTLIMLLDPESDVEIRDFYDKRHWMSTKEATEMMRELGRWAQGSLRQVWDAKDAAVLAVEAPSEAG